MNLHRTDALEDLRSPDVTRRLPAARFFERSADPADAALLRSLARREPDELVSRVLTRAAESAKAHSTTTDSPERKPDMEALALERSRALRDAAGMFLHEISPQIGEVELVAARLLPNYEGSDLEAAIEGVRTILATFEDLRSAADPGGSVEGDLTSAVSEIARSEAHRLGVPVSDGAAPAFSEDVGATAESGVGTRVVLAREDPVITVVSPRLFRLAFSNAIRNAIEACLELAAERSNLVVVSWGDTDMDAWVTVVDTGPGLPPGLGDPFEPGATSKREGGPHGMGLVIVREAVRSLGGSASLTEGESGGCIFEMRWPVGEAEQ